MDSAEIHPADEMYKTALISFQRDPAKARDFYLKSGQAICGRVASWLREDGRDPSTLSLLDFACGYGRVTRHFSKTFGGVVGADLEPNMLHFIKELCGVDGFLSNVDLARVKWPAREFDVVFTYSLFTHLHPDIWAAWFEAVSERVKPGGFMFFTTRGVEFARKTGEPVADGERVRFTEKNETEGRLDASVYGRTTLAREFVDDVLKSQRRAFPMARAAYFKGGEFDQYQDVHVLTRATGVHG